MDLETTKFQANRKWSAAQRLLKARLEVSTAISCLMEMGLTERSPELKALVGLSTELSRQAKALTVDVITLRLDMEEYARTNDLLPYLRLIR